MARAAGYPPGAGSRPTEGRRPGPPRAGAGLVPAALGAGSLSILALSWAGAPDAAGLGGWLGGVGRIWGVLAGYAALVLVALMARLPPVERAAGAARLARWNIAGGRSVTGLVITHALLAVWAAAIAARHGATDRTAWQVPGPAVGSHRILLLAVEASSTALRALLTAVPAPVLLAAAGITILSLGGTCSRDRLDDIAAARGVTMHHLSWSSDRPGGSPPTPRRLRALVPGLARHEVYLSGPPDIAGVAITALQTCGVPRDRIHFWPPEARGRGSVMEQSPLPVRHQETE